MLLNIQHAESAKLWLETAPFSNAQQENQSLSTALQIAFSAEGLAAAMVGRRRDGSLLLPQTDESIPGIPDDDRFNHFDYRLDSEGKQCPISSHIRRTSPRTGDLPPGDGGFISRLIKILGFGLKRPAEDLVASTRCLPLKSGIAVSSIGPIPPARC